MVHTKERDDVLATILTSVRGLVGPEAHDAMFHFAAVQAGRELANGSHGRDVQKLMGMLDGVLGHRTRLVEATSERVVLHVLDPTFFDPDNPATSPLMAGLVEGVMSQGMRRPHRCRPLPAPEAGFKGTLLELTPLPPGGGTPAEA